jgi:hypothetical protein
MRIINVKHFLDVKKWYILAVAHVIRLWGRERGENGKKKFLLTTLWHRPQGVGKF